MDRYWTKKLDTLHILDDEGDCLCGKPMLGNNYADCYKEIDLALGHTEERKICPICAEKKAGC